MNPDLAIIVPARLLSQRFPRKLLFPVNNKPLILWTAERLKKIGDGIPIYFAVAEKELHEILHESGYQTVMTDPDLPSGTDRIAAANRKIGARKIINVQADEPLVAREHIDQLRDALESGCDMATLATEFPHKEDFQDPHKVKVVRDHSGNALYFSRSPIPYHRDDPGGIGPAGALWHLGLYAYTSELINSFVEWDPSPLEVTEKLEQLRVLENGRKIRVNVTRHRTVGIDTPEDMQVFLQHIE